MNSNDVTLEKNRTLSDSIKKSSSSNKLRKPSQKKSRQTTEAIKPYKK